MSFEPIAIVGQACLLPGADSPEALWQGVVNRRDLTSSAPPDRWGLLHRDVRGTPERSGDRTWSDRGGYVRNFEGGELPELDPLFNWLIHVAREALRDAGMQDDNGTHTGAVVGNLSFPSHGMAQHAARVWLGDDLADACDLPRVDARNRFNSGLPALLMARTLGLGRGAFCMDAACASSLVAIKLACDRLHARTADVMLAGGVSCADDLFIHVGFCALQAMSPRGESRPFHRDADGLVPAEGAGMLVLERLSDAERKGHRILGVIRGVGLSNDGRGKGLLAPSEDGQHRAIANAYAHSGLSPDDVDYVECHATGTPTGDGTELRSMARVFNNELPIGSLKSNLGHLITAAGVAGVIKVLAAMKHGLLPPTLHVAHDTMLPALSETPFRVLTKPEPWPVRDGAPRRAAVSAFGFGGNNAHMIIEAYAPPRKAAPASKAAQATPAPPLAPTVVVVAMARRMIDGEDITLDLSRLRFPPKDLQAALPQQLLMLAIADEALTAVGELPRQTTGVLIGMGCDPTVARYGARWRLTDWARRWGIFDASWLQQARDAFVPELKAAGVLGTMPNIVANRINSAFDLGGSSMTLSGEELSGVCALQTAWRALQLGELDAALVGAVDMSREPVHQAALRDLEEHREPSDAAVALVLMRETDARARDLPMLATITDVGTSFEDCPNAHAEPLAHAATGLWRVAEAIDARRDGTVEIASAMGGLATVKLTAGVDAPRIERPQKGMRFRSRWPAPRLPAMPDRAPQDARPAASVANFQMARAPQLTPISNVLTDWPESPLPTTPDAQPPQPRAPIGDMRKQPVYATAGVAQPSPRTQPAQVAQPSAGPLAQASHYRTLLAQQHQQFVAQQLQVHQQFLSQRARTQQALLTMAQSNTVWAAPLPAASLPGAPMQAVPMPTAPMPAAPMPTAPAAAAPMAAAPMAAAPMAAAPPPAPPVLPGFALDRDALMVHAGGAISEVFGPELQAQDGYARQVRMPLPPLLLADRMVGIDAEIGSMGVGTIWTQTDVKADSWYLHHGRMPAGIMIEAGQADLMLISYLGVDLLNKGERVYRLLGCELTYHGSLPQPNETLCYDIHVDGHAAQGDIRLFFFHYECQVDGQPRLTVTNGQAGFFSGEELADSAGILWDATEASPCEAPRLDPGPCVSQRRSFDREHLEAFSEGRTFDCFGSGFEWASAHTDPPTISGGRMLFLDEVTDFDPSGGPWGRGYLRAADTIAPDDWFFDGHFHNDPCMPGTLMFEGCLQTMAIYLAALGFTIDRDAWRFEPVPEETFQLRCRGQVLPTSKKLVYEIFVEEVVDGPYPTLYADLLCTIDGLKAFHCRRMALRLVPDWPLERILAERPELLSTAPGAATMNGFTFDHKSLLACAWGRPSASFGAMYERFDSHRRVARLPGPPYHFMTRVESIEGELARFEPDQQIEVAYDIPSDAWYFDDNGFATMPYCVLLEAALQPCGWLASFVGSALTSDTDLVFRNLDGTSTLKAELPRDAGTLKTQAKIVGVSASAGMIIESFEVTCWLDDVIVYEMTTVFGFFPKEALEAQVGIPIPEDERDVLEAPNDTAIDLRQQPARYFGGSACLPSLQLLMIDRITGIWPEQNRYRSEQDVDPDAWYFKAHFFQDPVQPGSLGIEAMIQLLQFAMLERGLDEGMQNPRFEPLGLDTPLTWKYRGQVSVGNEHVNCIVDVLETGKDERGTYAIAKAALYVDGMRIYEAKNLGMRLVEGSPADGGDVIDPEKQRWLQDHRPTFTVPALPMMSMVDRMAAGALAQRPTQKVVAIDDVSIARWLPLPDSVRVRTDVICQTDGRYRCELLAWRQAGRSELSRFEVVAHATITVADAYDDAAAPPATLAAPEVEDPYRSGALFHGPAFHLLQSLRRSDKGASAELSAESVIPVGTLNQGLLDAATHLIPHDALEQWCSEISPGQVAYPYRISGMRVHGATPTTGTVRCEARFAGFDGDFRFPVITLALVVDERLWAELRLTEILLPKGPLGSAPPAHRRKFLRDREPVPGLSLSRRHDDTTRLNAAEVRTSNWLPGTLESLYRCEAEPEVIAVKEHVAATLKVHPCHVDAERFVSATHPITACAVNVTRDGDDAVVHTTAAPHTDLTTVVDYWDRHFNIGRWPVEDIYYGLIERFVRRVVVQDPDAFAAVRGKSVLYLANHQVAVESLLFSIIVSALSETPTVTLAKIEHRYTWLGKLIEHCFSYPDITDPRVITYFDRSDPSSLANIIGELARDMAGDGKSVMVHIEGTRALSCRTPVLKMTSAFIDMALNTQSPIVPVRFVGALPTEPLASRIEFPIGMGRQDIYLGTPIHPATFEALPYKDRKQVVISAINALGPSNEEEEPFPGDVAFDAQVGAYQAESGVSHEHATLHEVLRSRAQPSALVAQLLAREPAPKTPIGDWLSELNSRLVGPDA